MLDTAASESEGAPVPGGIPLEKFLMRINCDGFLVLKDGKVLKE